MLAESRHYRAALDAALQPGAAMRRHFEAVTIDQQEGLLAGTDSIGTRIIGRPLTTVEQFIQAHLSKFVLEYPSAATRR